VNLDLFALLDGRGWLYNLPTWTSRLPASSGKQRSFWKSTAPSSANSRSYEKTAELVDGLPESIEQLAKEPEKLKELPGIGDRMVEHLQEIVKTVTTHCAKSSSKNIQRPF